MVPEYKHNSVCTCSSLPSQAENSRKGQIRAVISIVKLQIAKSLNQPVLLIDSYCRRMVNVGIRMKFASGCKKGNQQNKAAVKKSASTKKTAAKKPAAKKTTTKSTKKSAAKTEE